MTAIDDIRTRIVDDPDNEAFTARGWQPVFTADARARIVILGQAPGAAAQETGHNWTDRSGTVLADWLGVDPDDLQGPHLATLPMDFYFPGAGDRGDNPPRRGFADRWHPPLLAAMPEIRLRLIVGAHAQRHHLGDRAGRTLTETVRAWRDFAPDTVPLVHPSPRNFRWHAKNPWFADEVVPALRRLVADALA